MIMGHPKKKKKKKKSPGYISNRKKSGKMIRFHFLEKIFIPWMNG
jgi:hypothetical protein